jgi:hypothetical protein
MSTIRDYVYQTISNTPGTGGNLTLSTAVTGNLALGAGDNGLTFEIEIEETSLGRESRRGCVYTHGTLTMTRGTLVKSTTGAAISFTAAATMRVVATEDWGNSVDGIRAAIVAGTSGGVPAFTAAGTLASSAALAAGELVRGGGAGAVPSTSGAATVTGALTITPPVGGQALAIPNVTQTTNAPVLNLAQTWNAGGVFFQGMQLNIVNIASASNSRVFDFLVNSTSLMSLDTNGILSVNSFNGAGGAFSTIAFHGTVGSNANAAVRDSLGFVVRAANVIGWVSNTNSGSGTADLMLSRAAAATLQLGAANAAAPVAQTLQSQGSRGTADSNVGGANLTLRPGAGTGTGTASSLIITAPDLAEPGTTQQTQTEVVRFNTRGAVFSKTVIETPVASLTLGTNGQFGVEMTSNTAGNLVYRGSDGVTRRCALVFS